MEALVILAVLCVLALLAACWGVDSRESLQSREQELAAFGFTWGPPAPSRTTTAHLAAQVDRLLRRHRPDEDVASMREWTDLFELELAAGRLADYRREAEMARLARLAGAPRRSLRGRLAGLLTALANWLDPETTGARRGPAAVGPIGGTLEAFSDYQG